MAAIPDEKFEYKDFKIITTTRKGNVNYSKIPELKNVDLEKYRAKDSVFRQIKVGKE